MHLTGKCMRTWRLPRTDRSSKEAADGERTELHRCNKTNRRRVSQVPVKETGRNGVELTKHDTGGIERKTDLYAENACEVPQVGEYDKCTVWRYPGIQTRQVLNAGGCQRIWVSAAGSRSDRRGIRVPEDPGNDAVWIPGCEGKGFPVEQIPGRCHSGKGNGKQIHTALWEAA